MKRWWPFFSFWHSLNASKDPAGCQPSTFDTPIGQMPSVRVNRQGNIDPFASEEDARAGAAALEKELHLFRNFEHLHWVITVPSADTHVLALRAETFPGVQSIEVSAKKPDGATEVLLFAKDLPLEWPTPYIFKDPVALRRGTNLFVTAHYANSADAPHVGGIRLTMQVK